jgi:hypothetical protein
MDFLANHWSPYVHEVDDIIDAERTDTGDILATFARAAMVFSHPFYLKHMAELRLLVLNITCAYADSVDWERTATSWKQQWADHYRHVGMEMVIAVAMICGGYDHARSISKEQREICHLDHHNKRGEPT